MKQNSNLLIRTLTTLFLLFFIITRVYAQLLPYQDISLSFENRAADLLGRLTIDEKISLMMNDSPAIDRLGIPKYEWWNEALHGVARAGRATVFPQSIALAATFDDRAVAETFDMVSDEARAKHHASKKEGDFSRYRGLTFWTPNINIFRDPRWGRGMETYGEDPYLTGRMGVAVVRGLQGDPGTRYDKTHACAKHYAVHSGPEWNRHSFNASNISRRDMLETYLPAFKKLVVEAGVKEVMCAYNRYEGEPCCSNENLLIRILREEWGFNGVVVSDCGAINDFWEKGRHGAYPDKATASAAAIIGGTDLECGRDLVALKEAFEKGAITETTINRAVLRLLIARMELGMFDDDSQVSWASIPMSVVESEKHKQKALEMARKSMVLLKNDNQTLPLSKNLKKVALIGPNANDSVMMWANYNGFPTHTVTILEGIQKKLPPGTVFYEKGCDLISTDPADHQAVVDMVSDADVIIFAGGISPQVEGEEMRVNFPGFRGGDRTSIELPQVQRDLLRVLKNTGKPVVFILCTGSAIALQPEHDTADAILNAWYPGQMGGTAVADILFGDYNPGGRLPVTFYTSTEQLPDFEDYDMTNGRTYRYMKEKPLYQFGHGLSYTTFTYRNGSLSRKKIRPGEPLSFRVTLKNSGTRAGDEVTQIYIRNLQDPEGPDISLRAFRRIHLAAGHKKKMTISLPPSAFEFFNPETESLMILPGEYEILYGGSSDREQLRSVRLTIALN